MEHFFLEENTFLGYESFLSKFDSVKELFSSLNNYKTFLTENNNHLVKLSIVFAESLKSDVEIKDVNFFFIELVVTDENSLNFFEMRIFCLWPCSLNFLKFSWIFFWMNPE